MIKPEIDVIDIFKPLTKQKIQTQIRKEKNDLSSTILT